VIERQSRELHHASFISERGWLMADVRYHHRPTFHVTATYKHTSTFTCAIRRTF